MSALTLSCVLLLLAVHTTIVCSQDGSHRHSLYVTHHEIDEVLEECENKIQALESEWERKQLALEAEKNYWRHSILSLFKQLYTTTSGDSFRQYCSSVLEQQQLARSEVEDLIKHLNTSRYGSIGGVENPAPSCKDLHILQPNSTSGLYWIRNQAGYKLQQYCDMEREGCGTRGGWMRVAHLDMTQPNQHCPPGFRTITSPKRLCGRPGPPGCVSVKFSTNNIPYNKVCGKVIAYQDKSTDGHCPYIGYHTDHRNHTIEEVYIDGVSITHGTPRQHIWTFIASIGENLNDCHGCPCYTQFIGPEIPFVGNNLFCDSGAEIWQGFRFYPDDPLWDGQGCGPRSECCNFNNPPWFCTELDQSTFDDVELRLCADQTTGDEDVPIEHIELYVQ